MSLSKFRRKGQRIGKTEYRGAPVWDDRIPVDVIGEQKAHRCKGKTVVLFGSQKTDPLPVVKRVCT